ncbi:MAG: SDR family oxidoreductase [Bacteroidales bacterium]|nr:SDR family oxidoreductase [Bacteroidales bacterium]
MEFCNLTGKAILVTGASSGIGRQTAILVSRLGGRLFLTGRDEGKLKETMAELAGEGHQSHAADLTDEQQMNGLVKALPALNGLVHCAGIIGPTPAKFIRQENIDKLFRINFEVPVLLTGKVLVARRLENGSSIVFMSSIVTKSPYFGGALYAGAKAALEAYSATLALELVNRRIRSNILSAALVNTPLMTDPAREGNPEIVDDSIQRYLKKYPMGIGEPEDVASLIAFLLADESKWISGANIPLGAVIQ